MYDMDGKWLIDVHLNGGTYNPGHRNPELVAILKEALDRCYHGHTGLAVVTGDPRSGIAKSDTPPDGPTACLRGQLVQ